MESEPDSSYRGKLVKWEAHASAGGGDAVDALEVDDVLDEVPSDVAVD